MDSQDLQKLLLLFRPEKQQFDLLKEYNNLLIIQIDDMKLHSFHKEEVKAILQHTITEISTHQQNEITPPPKTQNWFMRLLHNTAR
jgi:hypothetical protein